MPSDVELIIQRIRCMSSLNDYGMFHCTQGGEYSNGTACVPCPAGYQCPVPGETPERCPDGYFQDQEGQATCYECPGGYSCYNKSLTPEACEPGWYSLAGDASCRVGTRYLHLTYCVTVYHILGVPTPKDEFQTHLNCAMFSHYLKV